MGSDETLKNLFFSHVSNENLQIEYTFLIYIVHNIYYYGLVYEYRTIDKNCTRVFIHFGL